MSIRLDDQEKQMKDYINKLEQMEVRAKEGNLNVDEVINEWCANYGNCRVHYNCSGDGIRMSFWSKIGLAD